MIRFERLYAQCHRGLRHIRLLARPPAGVEIRDRIRESNEGVAMRPSRSKSRFKASINDQPWGNRVGECPQRRGECRRHGQPRVAVELGGKLQAAANKVREGEIQLLVRVIAGCTLASDQELSGIEVEMKVRDIFARKQGKCVIPASRTQAGLRAG